MKSHQIIKESACRFMHMKNGGKAPGIQQEVSKSVSSLLIMSPGYTSSQKTRNKSSGKEENIGVKTVIRNL
jgi:hypothetical protein